MSLPARGSPTLVQALPGPSVQVTAGSNHTAVLLMDGQVFTFGSFSVSKNISFYTPCKSAAFLGIVKFVDKTGMMAWCSTHADP